MKSWAFIQKATRGTGGPRHRDRLPEFSAVEPHACRRRAFACCCGLAALIRERKLEFDAWLVFEAGKTWPEAEAEVAEAIDFCEYYAREMARLAGPQTGGAIAGRAR